VTAKRVLYYARYITVITKLSLISLIHYIIIILEAIRAVRNISKTLETLRDEGGTGVWNFGSCGISQSSIESHFSFERVQGLLRVQPRVSRVKSRKLHRTRLLISFLWRITEIAFVILSALSHLAPGLASLYLWRMIHVDFAMMIIIIVQYVGWER